MKTSWRLSVEDKNLIVRLRGTGWTVKQLCEDYGVTPMAIYAILRGRGYESTAPGPGRKGYSDETQQRVLEMYRQGETCTKIAGELGMCTETVQHWLVAAGLYQKRVRPPMFPSSLTTRQKARRQHFHRIVVNHGVTPESLLGMYKEQRGKCRICGQHIRWGNGTATSVCVDHCHMAEKIRGLLCYNCNLGLGNFKDSLGLLMNAASYISRFTRKGSPCESAK
jgi:transposase-like protein